MTLEEQNNNTLIIVDDHEMMQIGLKCFIEAKSSFTVINTAKNIDSVKKILKSKIPQVIIIDVDLDRENGFDLALYIQNNYPSIKIIMYSMHEENDYVLKAKQMKLHGYISKASDSEEFIKCINIVMNGDYYIEERLIENQNIIEETLPLLTKREALIFQEMLKGKTNEEIAKVLKISKHSIEVYATTIYEKTFCKNRNEFLQKYR